MSDFFNGIVESKNNPYSGQQILLVRYQSLQEVFEQWVKNNPDSDKNGIIQAIFDIGCSMIALKYVIRYENSVILSPHVHIDDTNPQCWKSNFEYLCLLNHPLYK